MLQNLPQRLMPQDASERGEILQKSIENVTSQNKAGSNMI